MSGLLVMGLSAVLSAAVPCPGFDARLTANSVDLDRFYGALAIEVMQAGLANDAATLARLVSPEASYTLWSGDSGFDGDRGAKGAIGFARAVAPTDYRRWTEWSGPISVTVLECRWKVTLLFVRKPGEGAKLAFEFLDGRLIAVTGDLGDYSEGAMKPAAKP